MLKAYNRELKIELNPRAAKIRYLRKLIIWAVARTLLLILYDNVDFFSSV